MILNSTSTSYWKIPVDVVKNWPQNLWSIRSFSWEDQQRLCRQAKDGSPIVDAAGGKHPTVFLDWRSIWNRSRWLVLECALHLLLRQSHKGCLFVILFASQNPGVRHRLACDPPCVLTMSWPVGVLLQHFLDFLSRFSTERCLALLDLPSLAAIQLDVFWHFLERGPLTGRKTSPKTW